MDLLEELRAVSSMASVEGRAEAARVLATRLGATTALMFVLDRELDVLVPAPGFAPTTPGGPLWREFLARCRTRGTHQATVPYPDPSTVTSALACVGEDGAALVFLGSPSPHDALVEAGSLALSLLAATVRAEHRSVILEGNLTAALEGAHEARLLGAALADSQSELTDALAEASRLNQELQRASRCKDDFLAALSHELRNPLSSIAMALHVLSIRLQHQPSVGRELGVIRRQMDYLTRLVEDLLDISRIVQGKIELQRERLPFSAILNRAIETVEPLIHQQRHCLSVTLPQEVLLVDADALRLAQVFGNLLSNAAKYTDPGGRIDIVVEHREHRIHVRIRDSGAGIPPEHLASIFDLFAQSPNTATLRGGGLGIGLSLVRRLVEMHGGTVAAFSAGQGKGSEFLVVLPAAGYEDVTAAA